MAINMTISCEHPFGEEWKIDDEIGRGSYGVVYRLSRNDAGESMTSAMKWIPLPGDDEEIRRMYAEGMTRTSIREYYEKLKAGFSEEIQLLYRLRGNSHIVSLEDYRILPREGGDAVGYDIYIRMELLTSLEKWLQKRKDITFRDIVRIGEDLCDALHDCSRLSIIHRDIKPDNIFVTDDGRFKLGDFGIARRLQRDDLNASQRVGSLGYMSPEVYHAQPYDLRADIYSLGLVLYKLLNDRREPFAPPAPEAVTPLTANKANETRLGGAALPRPAKVPDSLERLWDIIQKACEYQPANRYQTPEEMKKAFQSIESLPAIDQPLELYSLDKASKEEKKEEDPSSSAGALNGTRYRTPSSSYDLNQTSPRSSTAPNHNAGREPIAPRKPITQAENQDSGAAKKRPVWIWFAAAAAALLVAAVLFIALGKSGPAAEPWTIRAEQVSESSVQLSWTGGPKEGVICRCFQNERQIRQDCTVESPFTFSGLAPGKAYCFELSAGEESSQLQVTTADEKTSEEIPTIERVDFYSIKLKYLGDEPLDKVKGANFDRITDNTFTLRSGPLSAQTASQTIWILFLSIPADRQAELTISLETGDNAAFSRSEMINLAETPNMATYRVSIDQLLEDVYMSYRSWPKEECSLRLYLDGMSVYETKIRIESGI